MRVTHVPLLTLNGTCKSPAVGFLELVVAIVIVLDLLDSGWYRCDMAHLTRTPSCLATVLPTMLSGGFAV